MMRLIGSVLGALMLSGPAVAAEMHDCFGPDATVGAEAWMIAEPWGDNTRLFANGQVRLAILDTISPAAGAFYLLILSPSSDVNDTVTCRLIASYGTSGYGFMTLDDMNSRYDPSQGLIFEIPITTGIDIDRQGQLSVVLNQATGEIQAEDIFP